MLVVGVQRHCATRFSRAADQRLGVIGIAAVGQRRGERPDVIFYRVNGRHGRRGGVYGKGERPGGRADVTRGIGGGDGQRIQTVCQRGRRRKAPVPRVVRQRGANRRAVIVNRDGAVYRRGTGERWQVVIAQIAAGKRAGLCADVILHAQQYWRGRYGGLYIDDERRGRAAGVACRIGGGQRQAVLAHLQRRGWRKAPVAVGIHQRRTERVIAVIDGNGIARRAAAVQGRLRIVGLLP